jgi:hypothetical protein
MLFLSLFCLCLFFVIASFTVIIPNANQAAWLSGGLLKKYPPNAEEGLCGTTCRQRLPAAIITSTPFAASTLSAVAQAGIDSG